MPIKDRRTTILDVANLAGVSKSTVSRVLTGSASVTSLTRSRVLAAINELGYEKDYRGTALRTGKSHAVGFIVPDLGNPVYSAIANATQTRLFAGGYSLWLGTYGSDVSNQYVVVEDFLSRGADALVLTPSSEADETLNAIIREARRPVVFVDRSDPAMVADIVRCLHAHGMTQALSHLANRGHERVVIIDRPANIYPGNATRHAAEAWSKNYDIQVDHLSCGTMSTTAGYDALLALAPLDPAKLAVVVTSHPLMVGVLEAMTVLGILPGTDVSFVGTSDSPISAVYQPPLTAIDRNLLDFGVAVADTVLTRLAGDSGEASRILRELPMRLVLRRSVLDYR